MFGRTWTRPQDALRYRAASAALRRSQLIRSCVEDLLHHLASSFAHSPRRNERAAAIAREVVAIAAELDASPAQVAVRWTMQRPQSVVPVVGARTAEQLLDTLGAADLTLTEEHLRRLHEVSQIELGFPHDFLQSDPVLDVLYGGMKARIRA